MVNSLDKKPESNPCHCLVQCYSMQYNDYAIHVLHILKRVIWNEFSVDDYNLQMLNTDAFA